MRTLLVAAAMVASLASCVSDDNNEDKKPKSAIARDHSAVEEFANSLNTETSTWSFRIKSDLVRDGVYGLMPDSGNQTIWDPATFCWIANNQAGIGANASAQPIRYVGNQYGFDWPSATIWMHPLQNGLTILSWLSPRDGVVAVSYSFDDIDANGVSRGGNGIKWFVEINDENGTLDSGTINEGGAGTGALQINNVSVKSGDRINFVIDPNGNYLFDSTGVTANISYLD